MIRIKSVLCKEEGETAEIDIEFEKDSELMSVHGVGQFIDIIDSQGYCDNWEFRVDGKLCDMEFSRFETYTFAEQVTYAILFCLYPEETCVSGNVFPA